MTKQQIENWRFYMLYGLFDDWAAIAGLVFTDWDCRFWIASSDLKYHFPVVRQE